MITQKFYTSIGLNEEQIKAMNKALESENRYRKILVNAGIHASAIERIVAKTDTSKIETMTDSMLLEMVKEEWKGFIETKSIKKERNI